MMTVRSFYAPTLAAMLMLSGCDRQDAAWREAREQDTETAYETFLDRHGDSEQAAEAHQRLRELREAAHFDEAQAIDSPDAYRSFLERYPDSALADAVRNRLGELHARETWARLQDSTDLEALNRFAGQYPDHAEARQARQRIAELEAQARVAEERTRQEAEQQRRMAEAAHSHRVQLAAYRASADASAGAVLLARQLQDVLGETALDIVVSGSYHLVQTEPLEEQAARRLCERLRAQGDDCIVVPR